ncbi:dihydroxyacetone kinase subunit DhaK, partial [Serratia ureilytica]|uniref:dihydroxyacetone kinase subunit DhaK n=1 Tax=Serratia ureilytica TaxID=300181 RepID=UPI0034C60F8A
AEAGIIIERNLVGAYCTSLDMQGVFITLLTVEDELLSLWDAPVKTPALRWGFWGGIMALPKPHVVDWLMRCGDVFSRERAFLTQLDTEIGDVDDGLNMHRGFNKGCLLYSSEAADHHGCVSISVIL